MRFGEHVRIVKKLGSFPDRLNKSERAHGKPPLGLQRCAGCWKRSWTAKDTRLHRLNSSTHGCNENITNITEYHQRRGSRRCPWHRIKVAGTVHCTAQHDVHSLVAYSCSFTAMWLCPLFHPPFSRHSTNLHPNNSDYFQACGPEIARHPLGQP
jgi:hypothetical protein